MRLSVSSTGKSNALAAGCGTVNILSEKLLNACQRQRGLCYFCRKLFVMTTSETEPKAPMRCKIRPGQPKVVICRECFSKRREAIHQSSPQAIRQRQWQKVIDDNREKKRHLIWEQKGLCYFCDAELTFHKGHPNSAKTTYREPRSARLRNPNNIRVATCESCRNPLNKRAYHKAMRA